MLTFALYYWLAGIVFACLCLWKGNKDGDIEMLYAEYMLDSIGQHQEFLSYKVFKAIIWVLVLLIIPVIYPYLFVKALMEKK